MTMTRLLAVLFVSILMIMPAGVSAAQQGTPAAGGNGESRETPLPVGQIGEVGDYEVRVVDVIPDATDVVMAENEFNDPPEPGDVFFIARVEVTYTGGDTGTPWVDLSFNVVGDQNRGYSESQAPCGDIPDEGFNAPELFEGGSVEFNVCWSVPAEEANSLVMYVEPAFSFDDERVWFSLDTEDGMSTPTG